MSNTRYPTPQNTGFVLVSTMFFMAVTAMMVSAALMLLPSSKLMSGTVSEHTQASQAAEAGIEYARTRLQEDPSWQGDGDAVIVNIDEQMWVRESQGNVVGILWSPSGEASMFKIRFNYQNGGGTPDEGLTDPPVQMRVESPYVSRNNLSGPSPVPLHRANSKTYKVTSSAAPTDVPKYSAIVYSEGYAGPAVRGSSPSDLLIDSSKGSLSHITVEAYLGRDVSKYGDSVLYGARDVSVNIAQNFLVESDDRVTPPRARSMGNISVSGGGSAPLDMTDGEVYVKPGDGRFTINSLDSTDPVATQIDSSAQFLQLGWDEIDKATSSDARLPAGTYVWRTSGVLDYYASDFDPALGIPSTTPDATYGSTADLPPSVAGSLELNPARLKMSFTRNVLIENNGSASGLTITSEPGLLAAFGRRPEAELDAPDPSSPSPILTMAGPFRLEGRIRGDGSITSEDDITFQGESVIEAKNDNRVAIYSKKDINIEPIPTTVLGSIVPPGSLPPTASYPAPAASASASPGGIVDFFDGALPPFGLPLPNDVAFGGVIYAQGSFNINLGTTSNFHLHGVMVAYGGDSAAGELPGARLGTGYVNLTAKNAQLLYDSSYVANLIDQNAATKLEVISWRQR